MVFAETRRMEKQAPKSLPDALAFVADYIESSLPPVRTSLSEASGLALAENINAPVSLPRFDNAAMDGFAIRFSDIRPDGTATLKVEQTIAAGQLVAPELRPGEAARITTGAPMPAEADRVVLQEVAKVEGDKVHLKAEVGGKPHIRRVGEDVAKGDILLERGVVIGPGQTALLTALGLRSVLVTPRPKVGLLSTGDELVNSPGFLKTGQIYDTNRPMLLRMLQAVEAEVTDLGIVRDDPERILATLVEAASDHDLLISSGGASAGFADHLTQVVSRRGFLEFWKLGLQPGRPIGFGDIDDCPILLLPGNPLAAAVGFTLIGRAIIARLAGRRLTDDGIWRLPVVSSITRTKGGTQVLLGRLGCESGQATMVEPLPYEGSASLRSLALADVMIILHPEQTIISEGDFVDIVPIQ